MRRFLEGVEEEALKWDIGGGGAFNHSAVYWRKGTGGHGKIESDNVRVDGANTFEAISDDIRAVNI